MHNYSSSTIVASIAMVFSGLSLVGTANAQADITEISGAVSLRDPPVNILLNQWESDSEIRCWFERYLTLETDQHIGYTGPVIINVGSPLQDGTVPSGTRLSSFMIRHDPVGAGPVTLVGSVTFSTPIIGVYAGNGIETRDAIFALPNIMYNMNPFRALELTADSGGTDGFTVSEDRLRIDFEMAVGEWTDDIRVLVEEQTTTDQFDRNLVRNGSFEITTPNPNGVLLRELPDGTNERADLLDWVVFPAITNEAVISSDRYLGVFSVPRTGVVAGGRDSYLLGAFFAESRMFQIINLTFASSLIDNNGAQYRFDSLLGSFFGGTFPEFQDDIATVHLTFLDGELTPNVLRVDTLEGPSRPEDVGLSLTGTGSFSAPFSLIRGVPVGTRQVKLSIVLTRDSEAADNAFNNASVELVQFSVQPRCPADVNNDGSLTPTDFTAWINAFNNNLPECDQNGDGSCTPTDFTAWIANFNAGC